MGFLDRISEALAQSREQREKEERELEQQEADRTLYLPIKQFEIPLLDDIELTPIGHGMAIVEWDDQEIGLVECPLDEDQIDLAEEITLSMHDGKICVRIVQDEEEAIDRPSPWRVDELNADALEETPPTKVEIEDEQLEELDDEEFEQDEIDEFDEFDETDDGMPYEEQPDDV